MKYQRITKIWLAVSLAALYALTAAASGDKIKPGSERWGAKTGQLEGAVNLSLLPFSTTILDLIGLHRPVPPLPENKKGWTAAWLDTFRIEPIETTYWQVEATIKEFKLESDGDYHVVIEDDAGHTMVAEIVKPSNAFVGKDNIWRSRMESVRSSFNHKYGLHEAKNPSGFKDGKGYKARLSGFGFFDRLHNQTGMADNCLELHPVLALKWLG